MQNFVHNPLKWQRQLGRPRCEWINNIEIYGQNRMGHCEYYVKIRRKQFKKIVLAKELIHSPQTWNIRAGSRVERSYNYNLAKRKIVLKTTGLW